MADILIIDDDPSVLSLITKVCQRLGHDTHPFQSGKEGLAAVDRIEPELMLVDLRIGDINGLEIIRHCGENHPKTAVIMVTGYGSVETAVEAMRLGAFDYLTKPFELDDLERTVTLAVERRHRERPTDAKSEPEEDATRPSRSARVIGKSSAMELIRSVIDRIADNDNPILLEGEFGSGKQVAARSIHDASRRHKAPFKVLAASALPEDLLELELFGGAGHKGETLFSRASGGTVLLEEIDMLPLRLQSQLETHLEQLTSERLDGDRGHGEPARFIASSNKSLEQQVEAGKFRADLYYKISVIPIEVPPLRDRPEDIPLLVQHFLDRDAAISGAETPCRIDDYALELLERYRWPGNVGELQNAIEHGCAFAEDGLIRPRDLPTKVAQKRMDEPTAAGNSGSPRLPIGRPLSEFVKEQESLFVRETLRFNEGSREKAASMLGVSIATLYRKLDLSQDRKRLPSETAAAAAEE